MVFEPNASASLSQTCWAIERRSATPGERRIKISRMPSSVAVKAGRCPRTSTSRAVGSNSTSPIVIRALQRRPPVSQAPRIKIGEVEFDPAAREVLVRGERPAFTGTELGILEILMRRSPGVADRRSIAQHVWDNEADAFGSNTIDVHLARLRSKLAGAGVRIETVRGVGYRITPA